MVNMNFDLNALKIFIAVYENNGIDVASKKLFLSQPAVSIAIQKLENRLNGKLFKRLPRGIEHTQEGERFYEFCKNGMAQIDFGIENFSEKTALSSGVLNIGASSSMIKHILMPVLNKFCLLYPDVKITFTEVIAERLQKYLFKGEIDIAFIEEPIKDMQIYDSTKVCSLTNSFVASSEFVKNALTKEELEKQKLAVLKKNTTSRLLFEKICFQNNINPNICYQMASFETLALFCKSNLAIGFAVYELIADFILSGELKEIETDINLPNSDVYALLPKGEASGFLCQKFLEFLLKNVNVV